MGDSIFYCIEVDTQLGGILTSVLNATRNGKFHSM